MSKSCWQPNHFHMAVFPPRAARLWRMVTHAWAVIISHAGVSSGSRRPDMLLCDTMAGRRSSLVLQLRAKPHLSLQPALPHQSAREANGNTQLATRRLGSATLSTVHRNSPSLKRSHTRAHTPSLSGSLTLTAATAVDVEAAAAGAAAAAAAGFPSPHSGYREEFIFPRSAVYSGHRISENMRGGNTNHLCTPKRRCQRCVDSGWLVGKTNKQAKITGGWLSRWGRVKTRFIFAKIDFYGKGFAWRLHHPTRVKGLGFTTGSAAWRKRGADTKGFRRH